jgi:hypothetical protein
VFELYDLERDPREFNNLAGDREARKVERRLKRVLQEWMILERDYLPLPIVPDPPGATTTSPARSSRSRRK